MLRNLLRITSPVGRPATQLELGHSGGRWLYVVVAQRHAAMSVALAPEQVEHLRDACATWLELREGQGAPFSGGLFRAEQSPDAEAV
jgi:hypothetical protein